MINEMYIRRRDEASVENSKEFIQVHYPKGITVLCLVGVKCIFVHVCVCTCVYTCVCAYSQ